MNSHVALFNQPLIRSRQEPTAPAGISSLSSAVYRIFKAYCCLLLYCLQFDQPLIFLPRLPTYKQSHRDLQTVYSGIVEDFLKFFFCLANGSVQTSFLLFQFYDSLRQLFCLFVDSYTFSSFAFETVRLIGTVIPDSSSPLFFIA